MREIKFRVWDTQDDKRREPFGEIWSLSEMLSRDRFEVMQFTGLYDNKRTKEYPNGQPIYEGDIVKILLGDEWYIEKIEYKSDRFRVTNYNGGHDKLWYYCTLNLIEVIGNIYENPELLKTD